MRARHHPSPDTLAARFVWTPGDESVHLRRFADAASIAFSLPDLPVENDAIVLLDDDRVVSMIIDPTPMLKMRLTDVVGGPGFEQPFSAVLVFRLRGHVEDGPPAERDLRWYRDQQAAFEQQGLEVIDCFDVSTDMIRSYGLCNGAWDAA